MAEELNGVRVAAIATDGFEEAELVEPKKALEAAGAKVDVLSPKSGEIQGFKHHDRSNKVKVDRAIADADPEQYDAVLLPGGALNADAIRIDEDAKDFVREMDNAGKPLAVICHGPWLLVSADLVEGRKMTSWPTVRDDIENAGGDWEDHEVIRDANWVSSRKPDDIPAFNREFIKLIAERKERQAA